MRKRAQRVTPSVEAMPIKKKLEKRKIKFKKNYWFGVSLICIFFLVLILTSYFNITSGIFVNPSGKGIDDKFLLSGPDPYYNMRIVENIVETGRYPFYAEEDPILNYPLGRSGGRAPLLNMIAIGFSRLLMPFMNEVDAVGYSMQFLPSLFGALLVFPVYFIGKTLFGRKEGLIAALLVPLIPIHIGSGHGSAYGLFDHDSFNLLLFFLTFFFLIKSIKDKNRKTSMLYALLSGTSLAGLSMVWVEARFLYAVIAIYAIVQMLADIFTSKINRDFVRNMLTILFTGYLVSLPVLMARWGGFRLDIPLFLCFGILLFGFVYIVLDIKRIPWVISLPAIFCGAGAVATFLYFVKDISSSFPFLAPLNKIREVLFGSGIYGDKVSGTIAEAGTFGISRSVISYGPAIYWLAWAGFVLMVYHYYRQKGRRDYLFIIVLFLIDIWLTSTAGRFLNDVVPLVALLGGWVTWFVIGKIDYKQMLKNIRHAGGGLRGIRKGIKVFHILGIIFVSLLIVLPNAFLSLDASIPSDITRATFFNGTPTMKMTYFGEEHASAFGSSTYKEQYWVDAFTWLKQQDTHIEDPTKRPAIISWWDYGFYESAVGEHPTVADNFQDGIPPAANFHTAKSEKEAVAVWIIRLLEGNLKDNNGFLSADVVDVLKKHIGENKTSNVTRWMENPTLSPSYNAPIGKEYDEELSEELRVGEQYPENACYHDITELLNNTLDDEGITWLYHDIQQTTGYSIRYYAVEGYDYYSISDIFAFLADKSLVLYAFRKAGGERFPNPEDDFVKVKYTGYYVNPDGTRGDEGTWTAEQLNNMSRENRPYITDTKSEKKPDFYKTMLHRVYKGQIPEELQAQVQQLPCWNMRHFTAEYVSPLPYYNQRTNAVIIAKYYEGAKIKGSVEFMGKPLDVQVVVQKNISMYGDSFAIDHDYTSTVNGTFSLIAPAGNISLQLRRNTELGVRSVAIKTITFNSTTNPALAPISDDEAMRLVENYTRIVNITVEPSNLEGYVYENKDANETYNASIDEPLANVEINLIEIEEIDPSTGEILEVGDSTRVLTTNESGYYNTSNLRPGLYRVMAILDDFVLHDGYARLITANERYNISKPLPSAVNGKVYFDANKNEEYDPGEEMSDIDVKILYRKLDGDTKFVDSITTNETGEYSFSMLIPPISETGYVINASKLNVTTGYLDYVGEESVELIKNQTTEANISINYAPIIVQGTTQHENQPLEGIEVVFSPDMSIENNTAEETRVVSDESGVYKVDLMPGAYNVSVNTTITEGTYSYEGKLIAKMGEGRKTLNIPLTKLSVTVKGQTRHNDTPIGNISILFAPDMAIENNTAVAASADSDEEGAYSVELMPGFYNITVDTVIAENGVNVSYTYRGHLEVRKGEDAVSFNIALAREAF
jgi:dolichyl-diphosphooligosaccharide--protein glycosyltransferase